MPVLSARSVNVTPRSLRMRFSRGPTRSRAAAIVPESDMESFHAGFPELATIVVGRSVRAHADPMNEYDVIVVGGGAAGLSAALVLARARRRVAVLDAGRPRNAPAAHMHGFLGSDGRPPAELTAAGRREVAGYGGHLISGTVTGI